MTILTDDSECILINQKKKKDDSECKEQVH